MLGRNLIKKEKMWMIEVENIKINDKQYGHCYLLDEEEYCEYQCLKLKLDEWNKMLDEAKEIIKTMRRK